MAWVRIDDQAPRNEKMLKAGPAACWLWVCGIAHCQSQLTDGFISDHVLAMIGVNGVPRCKRLANQLVSAGLFERTQKGSQNGYLVHDYLAFNDTAAVARAYKRQVYETKARAGRAGGLNRRIGTVERREPEEADAKQTASTQREHLLSSSEAEAKQTEHASAKPHPIPSHPKEQERERDARARGLEDEGVALRAGRLVDRYGELFFELRHGAKYHPRPTLDWQDACGLCRTWADDRHLEQLARIVLMTDDPFISRTDRSFHIFAIKASWADDRLRAVEREAG